MPSLQPPARILVTGATGFIAAWIVRSLLDAGFSVRGTARSHPKADFLKKLFAKEVEEGRFETAIVEDVGHPDAFDEAIKGVDGIAHTASPCHYDIDDPDEFIKPAVQGTVGVLGSALKYNQNLKRAIILSSCSAVVQLDPGRPLTENDWNEHSVPEVEKKGKKASSLDKYRASKTLAEKAAWDFHEKHRGEIGWDVVSLNPPFVYGPPIHEVSSPSSLNTSILGLFNVLCKPYAGGMTDEQLVVGGSYRVDVRDMAKAMKKAFLTEQAGGERFIISAGNYTWQEMLDVAHQVFPEAGDAIYRGRPGAGRHVSHPVQYENGKSKKLLGMEYLPLEDTIRDFLKDVVERGWFSFA